MKTISALFTDLLYLYLPWLMPRQEYAVAFLVHPRDRTDMYRKYSFLQYFPSFIVSAIEHFLWPITVSRITGLQDENNHKVPGYVISIPMTAPTMLAHRKRALRQIRAAVRLARNKGVRIVGLGALTSSLSAGGTALTDISGIAITTGHAYTGFSVTQNLFKFTQEQQINPTKLTVAIVGAAGSIGSISAQILARAQISKLILVDVERKQEAVRELASTLEIEHKYTNTILTSDLAHLRDAHVVITATNTPDALVRSEHLTPGTVIIDDAQPSDVAQDVFDNKDNAVLEAGAVYTPGISANFDMGLHGEFANYCCMAELLVLGSQRRTTNHTILRATLAQVDSLGTQGTALGFIVAPPQNMFGMISNEHLAHVATLMRARLSA